MSVELCALIAVACAALVGIITYKRREKIESNWRKRLVRKAKKHKSYAEAFMVQRETGPNREQIITYEYEVGKSKYRKKITYGPYENYSNRIIVYYKVQAPAFGVCEERAETNDHIGLSVFGWSFLTLMGTFIVLECTVGRHNSMWNEELEMAYGEMEVIFSHPQLLGVGALAVALYILEFKWFSKMLDKNKAAWERKKEEAIAAGRTALASKKSQSYDRDSNDDRTYHATYVYTINGREYKYGHHFHVEPPHTLQIYYKDNPAKAFSSYDDHNVFFHLLAPVLFVFPIACTYFLLKLFGVDMEWLASL